MKDFNDVIWERYLDTRRRLARLERRYIFVISTLFILTLTYAHLYFRYFKGFTY